MHHIYYLIFNLVSYTSIHRFKNHEFTYEFYLYLSSFMLY